MTRYGMQEQYGVQKTIEDDTLTRAMRARIELMGKTGEKLVDEHRQRVAETLLSCGITLIPSEHLLDHQFVVSQGVYEAAKRMIPSV